MAGLIESPAADRLSAFLRDQMRRGFDWSTAHCLLLPADWMVANGLPDPAAGWRDRIADESAALAALEQAGGMDAFARRAMARIGARARPAHGVRRGDVGVVRMMGPDGPAEAGGICTGKRWAVRSPRGLAFVPGQPLVVWRVTDCAPYRAMGREV